jgi:sulfhydrogenase subunit gamma (sulfur reductase)
MSRLLVPELGTIDSMETLTPDTQLFQVSLPGGTPSYRPGQFYELSVLGVGECPISITSTPTREGPLEFAIREVGRVTHAIHNLQAGDQVGLRGPLGHGFPVEELEGMDLLFITGGIGLAPLRSLIQYVLDRREAYGQVDIVYGARTPELLCFRRDLEAWGQAPSTRVHLTVDREAPDWDGRVGFVPAVVQDLGLSPRNRVALACGPPVMIRIVLRDLQEAGYRPEHVITTLELKMKCGVGKCGRCNLGPLYICKDGPVFTLAQLQALPGEY